MKKGPHLIVYDETNEERLSGLDFGAMKSNSVAPEIRVWLWNKKDFSNAPTAVDVRVCVKAANQAGQRAIDEKWLLVQSSGVMDPDGVGIVDDEEAIYTAVGGSLLNVGEYHSIGDIPTNCARGLNFKLAVPDLDEPVGRPRLIIEVGFFSEEVKWLYAED